MRTLTKKAPARAFGFPIRACVIAALTTFVFTSILSAQNPGSEPRSPERPGLLPSLPPPEQIPEPTPASTPIPAPTPSIDLAPLDGATEIDARPTPTPPIPTNEDWTTNRREAMRTSQGTVLGTNEADSESAPARSGQAVESDLDLLSLPGGGGAAPKPTPAVPPLIPVALAQSGQDRSLTIKLRDKGEIPGRRLLLVKPGDELVFEVGLNLSESDEKSGAPMDGKSDFGGRHVIESSRRVELGTTGGTVKSFTPDSFSWTAPEKPGLQILSVEVSQNYKSEGASGGPSDHSKSLLGRQNIAVMVQYPYTRTESLIETYPIGLYPDENAPSVPGAVSRDPSRYAPPQWFVKVDNQTKDYLLSENFTLGDFASPSERDTTHFVAIEPDLIDYLEAVYAKVKQRFGEGAHLKILRSYLSPLERQRLDQKGASYTPFSRFQYGDAAALVVDLDGSGKLGDLNNDGRVDREDANVLADILDEVKNDLKLRGASGVVDRPSESSMPESPYAVVDLRGVNTRW